MIDRQKYNKKIVFSVRKNSGQCCYLQLSPDNFQQQFIQFVITNKLTKQQAQQLKMRVQQSLSSKVQQIKQLHVLQQKQVVQQQQQWRQTGNIQTQKYSNNQQRIRTQQNQLARFVNKHDNHVRKHSQIGIQVQCHTQQKKAQNNKLKNQLNLKQQKDVSQSFKINRQNNEQQQIDIQSPRFKQIELTSPESIKVSQNQKQSEEDIKPRQFPFNTPSNLNKSTQANTPQKFIFNQNVKRQHPIFTNIQTKKGNLNKPVLLQNYKKLKSRSRSNSPSQQKDISFDREEIPSIKYYKYQHLFKRLHETQTASSKSKKMQQINSKEIKAYNQYLKQIQHIPHPHISQFQDLSKKTTKSYLAKLQPEINPTQIKQQKQFKISFQQHLKKKQQQNLIKQKTIKSGQIQSKKFQLRGAHCQYKIERQKAEKIIKEQQEKQRKIKQRIKQQKKQHTNRELWKKSCSPASKSRQCLACKPAHSPNCQKSSALHSKQKGKPFIAKTSPNKKYVSNILTQAFQQFAEQVKHA